MYIDTLDSFNSSIIWCGIHSTPRYSIRIMAARYGSNRGHDSLVCFSISKDGLLKLEGFTYTGGAAEDGWDFAVGMDIDGDIDGDFGVEIEVPEDYNLSPRILQMCQNMSLCCSSMVQESILGILPSIHLEIGSWWRTKMLDSTLLTLCTDRLWGFQHAAFVSERALHCKLWEVRFESFWILEDSADIFWCLFWRFIFTKLPTNLWQDSDNVVVFRRDRRSGKLEDSGQRAKMKTARWEPGPP